MIHWVTCTATYMLGIDNVDSADSNAHDPMIALSKIQMCRIAKRQVKLCFFSSFPVWRHEKLNNWDCWWNIDDLIDINVFISWILIDRFLLNSFGIVYHTFIWLKVNLSFSKSNKEIFLNIFTKFWMLIL